MLNDGELYHEDTISKQIESFNNDDIMLIMVFVDQTTPSFFANLETSGKVVNYQTRAVDIGKTIAEEIYKLILKSTRYFKPPQYNTSSSSYTSFLDNKMYITADEEIMHGAEIAIEYLIKIESFEDIKRIFVKDICSPNLMYNKDDKLITENHTNAQEGWKISNNNLIYEAGVNSQSVSKNEEGIIEYEIKVVLCTILTSGSSYDYIFSNKIEFELELENGEEIKLENGKVYLSEDGEITESDIKEIQATDVIILPPFGNNEEKYINNVKYITISIVIVILIAIAIIAEVKSRKKKTKDS